MFRKLLDKLFPKVEMMSHSELAVLEVDSDNVLYNDDVKIVSNSNKPFAIESRFYRIWLDDDWREVPGMDSQQFVFEHKYRDFCIVTSSIFYESLPDEKYKGLATTLADARQSGSVEINKGMNVTVEFDGPIVSKQSWGLQVSLTTRTSAGDIEMFSGFVSEYFTLQLSLETKTESALEISKQFEILLTSIRFNDEAWGKKIPPNGTLAS